MVTPTNQIVLTYKDGRTISIVQTAEGAYPAGSKYGHSVEVWIDGHEEPNINYFVLKLYLLTHSSA